MSKLHVKISTLFSRSKKAQEVFELKSEKIEENKTVTIAIHDFTKRIDYQEKKKKEIVSPEFKVGDISFTVSVYPQDWRENSTEHISVYLGNKEKEEVTATVVFKHASGAKGSLMNQIEAGHGRGSKRFLSHEAYKEWAKDHGDVFKVEVKITLHTQPAQWTSTR